MNTISYELTIAIFMTFFIGLVLAISAQSKLRSLDEFKGVVDNYRLLPAFLVAPVAFLLPFIEMICAVALMVPAFHQAAAWIAVGLFSMFTLALAINVGRGRTHIDCGCVRRPTSMSRIGMFHVLRALLLAGMSAYIAIIPVTISSVSATSWLIGTAAALFATLIYHTVDVLVGLPDRRSINS